MNVVWHFVRLSSPLYGLVLAGYLIASLPGWRQEWSVRAARLVFAVVLPAMLLHLMMHETSVSGADSRVLIAYFGSCLIVFFAGRAVAFWMFRMDGVSQSVFGLGGVFSNIVLTGLPISRIALGDAAVPIVALLLVFNALTLWTLVSVSVEWSLHGALSVRGFSRTLLNVLRNPIILSILGGAALGRAGVTLPTLVDTGLGAVGGIAGPAALLTLGFELRGFTIRRALSSTLALCAIKLVVQPSIVWLLALALGLSALELRAVVLVASMSVGINVYLMAARFGALQGEVAGAVVLSNVLAALTTPLLLAGLQAP